MTFTLDEIGQSVRNNIQLIVDHVGLLLAVGPFSDNDYKILCGDYGELKWSYTLSTYGNSREKYEFCMRLAQQGRVQRIPPGATTCAYGVEEDTFRIHMIERFSREDESHPLKGRMVLPTLMSIFIFCRAVECRVVRTVEPVPELAQYYKSFGSRMKQYGYVMSAVTDKLQDTFLKFAQQVQTRRGYELQDTRPDYLKGVSTAVVLCLNY